MQSLKDDILTKLSGGTADVIAGEVGLEKGQADAAINTALDALLGGLQQNVKSEDGAKSLDKALSEDHDGSVLDNVNSAVTSNALRLDGAKILEHIFGSKTETVSREASKQAGTGSNVMTEMMKVLAPIVLGQLGKAKSEDKLDAGGLADKLLREKLPKGGVMDLLVGVLDRDKDGQILDDVLELGKNMFKQK